MRDPEKRLHRRVRETVLSYGMLNPGDRVLLGLSGGKDSFSLALMMLRLRREIPFHLGIRVYQHEYLDGEALDGQIGLLRSLGAEDCRIEPLSLHRRLAPGRALNCFWCSRQWRAGLLEEACREGYGRIALGHTQDDLLITFLMNMAYRSEISALDPVFAYRDYPVRVIRPLIQSDEGAVREYLGFSGMDAYLVQTNCPYKDRTRRDRFRGYLDSLAAGEGNFVRDHLFAALQGANGLHLP